MMRSLFSGVSGLKTHQTKMDVIGNNIANVNTVGFKSSSVTFSELMYQTTQSASGANADTGRGGVNARQIGLGVTSGAINTNITTSGSSQTTGNPFDLQISGDSFFIVSDGTQNYFTRAGAFYVDGSGNLAMTSNGFKVMGWQEDADNPGTIKKDIVSSLKITTATNMTSEPEATTQAYITGILDKNSTGLTSSSGQAVSIPFYDNAGTSYTAKYAIYSTDDSGNALDEGVYRMVLTDIVDSDGDSIVTGSNTLADYVTISGAATPTNTIYLAYDIDDGTYIGWDTVATTTPTNQVDATSGEETNPFKMTFTEAGYPDTITVGMNTTTRWDNSGTSTITGKKGDYDGNYTGRTYGTMSGVSIDTSGMIYASYSNGTSKLLGQIAVASFANPSGLEKIGENLYQTTQNSGDFDGVGNDVTADGVGKISTGVLEMSNVDLSSEFTEMITTQRGFQANSRIITVSDTMLEELTNLKR